MEQSIQHPVGAPPPPSRTTYMSLDAKAGCFTFTEEKDGPRLRAQYVMGPLRQLWLEWDEGNPNSDPKKHVPARWEIHCVIESRDNGTVHLTVSSGAAVYVFASQINQLSRDTYISITAKPGEHATLTEVAVWFGNWAHIFTKKSDGSPIEERTWKALQELSTHSAYVEPTAGKAFTEGRLWSQKTGQPVGAEAITEAPAPQAAVAPQAQFTGAAGDGENPAATAPGRTAPRAEPSVATPARVAPVPEGANAFGFKPTRWPKAESWSLEWTEEQSIAVLRLLENIEPKYRLPLMHTLVVAYSQSVPQESAREIVFVDIAQADAQPTKAYAILIKDFIEKAADAQWNSLFETAKRSCDAVTVKPKEGEPDYDPFAED